MFNVECIIKPSILKAILPIDAIFVKILCIEKNIILEKLFIWKKKI
jgi:hypothetical protein